MEKKYFPLTQRRIRAGEQIRELTASIRLTHKAFIQPLFVEEGIAMPRLVEGLGDVQVDTIHSVVETIEESIKGGITKFLLFPVPATKQERDFDFSFAVNLTQTIKKNFGNSIWLAIDVCLCSYTTHGHCGLLNAQHTQLLNSPTVEVLVSYATKLAAAGADCIAPSDMMDGRIGAIRTQLNAMEFDAVSIMSYAVKFSSQLYGPFRDACHSAPNTTGLQNRKTYQLSAGNINDAIASAVNDDEQGADIVMIKPAALYTDVISAVKQNTLKPVAAYHVSGEYAAIEALAEKGLVNKQAAHLEVWTALARAGANIIISYAAKNAKEWIDKMEY
jgi:porphobilinogen synthase